MSTTPNMIDRLRDIEAAMELVAQALEQHHKSVTSLQAAVEVAREQIEEATQPPFEFSPEERAAFLRRN